MDKVTVRWTCDSCHEECVSVAWRRASDAEDFEPVIVRARCPICGNVGPRAFRPGTDENTHETYTLAEWTKRGETERATRHAILGREERDEEPAADRELSEEDLQEFDTKTRQCQPPHLASTWQLVPPVNEWYAADVPRLVAEVRRLRARLPARRPPLKRP
jgi:hypothetical protein